jgi:hypothetical protein
VPLLVRASLGEDRIGGDVYAVLPQSFEVITREFAKPIVWCDILTLHFNVKSCQPEPAREREGGVDLRIATARKHYVPPSGRRPLVYALELARPGEGVVVASLRAAKGPLGVRDMQIEVGAIPAPEGGSFVHLHYAYTEGFATRLATRTYLATVARRKVGFSVVGETSEGDPVYIRGAAGAVERNALRYHLAIEAYFDTLTVASEERFEARIARWYRLTDRYRTQLYELPLDRYLDIKRRERRDMDVQAAASLDRRRR